MDLSDGRVFVSNTTSIALPGSLFGLGVFDVRVRCLSATGFKAISSESRSILNSKNSNFSMFFKSTLFFVCKKFVVIVVYPY